MAGSPSTTRTLTLAGTEVPRVGLGTNRLTREKRTFCVRRSRRVSA